MKTLTNLEIYKQKLIPKLSTEALKDQEIKFKKSWEYYHDREAQSILIAIQMELANRTANEIKEIDELLKQENK